MKTLRLLLSVLLLIVGGMSSTLLAQSYYNGPDYEIDGVGYCKCQTRDFTGDGVTIVSIPSGVSDFTLPSEISFDEERTVNGYTYTVTTRYRVYGMGFFAQLVGDGPGNYHYVWEDVNISSQDIRTLRINHLMNGGLYLNKNSLPYLHNVYFASGTLPPTNEALSCWWDNTHVYNALEPNMAAWREKGANIVLELNEDNSYTVDDVTYYMDNDNRSAYVYSIGGNSESISIPYDIQGRNQGYYRVVALGVPGFKMQSTNANLKVE